MTPLDLLNDLFEHQAWADLELVRAVEAHPSAGSDEKMVRTIQHIVVVQRWFIALLRSTPFDIPAETKPVESMAALRQLCELSHTHLLSFVKGLDVEALGRIVHNPSMPDLKSTVSETLMQVVLHSQNHRGQCLMRLREIAGQAPVLDYILWLKHGRPRPVYAGQGAISAS